MRFAVAVIAAIGIIKIMQEWEEPYSIIASILLSTLIPAIWFATNILIIDNDQHTIFDGRWIMGFKKGKTTSYREIDKFFVNKVKTKRTIYSLSNKQNMVTNHEYRAFLKLDDGSKFYLLSHPVEESVNEKVTKIRQKLQTDQSQKSIDG